MMHLVQQILHSHAMYLSLLGIELGYTSLKRILELFINLRSCSSFKVLLLVRIRHRWNLLSLWCFSLNILIPYWRVNLLWNLSASPISRVLNRLATVSNLKCVSSFFTFLQYLAYFLLSSFKSL